MEARRPGAPRDGLLGHGAAGEGNRELRISGVCVTCWWTGHINGQIGTAELGEELNLGKAVPQGPDRRFGRRTRG